jgi:hypothetical protein
MTPREDGAGAKPFAVGARRTADAKIRSDVIV